MIIFGNDGIVELISPREKRGGIYRRISGTLDGQIDDPRDENTFQSDGECQVINLLAFL
jgi:hypothetical protein